MTQSKKLVVYFDGACHLCSREIEAYKRKDTAHSIDFIDIASHGFDAKSHGLDPVQVNREMHVRLGNGELRTAVSAFRAIWDVLPGYGWLSRLTSLPVIRQLLDIAYVIFARGIRPYLPKRRHECGTDVCRR